MLVQSTYSDCNSSSLSHLSCPVFLESRRRICRCRASSVFSKRRERRKGGCRQHLLSTLLFVTFPFHQRILSCEDVVIGTVSVCSECSAALYVLVLFIVLRYLFWQFVVLVVKIITCVHLLKGVCKGQGCRREGVQIIIATGKALALHLRGGICVTWTTIFFCFSAGFVVCLW